MRGGKRVRGGNHVNWAGEEDVQTVDCKMNREKRTEKKVERRRKREERGEGEETKWEEEQREEDEKEKEKMG
jgi:hypothetical protein